MRKAIDIVIGLGANFFIFMLWTFEMIVTGDIPVNISFNEFVSILILLILSLIIYCFYIRKTKYMLMNILLVLIPLFLWFISMKQALTYNYHKYDTMLVVIGFSMTLISFLKLIYRKAKFTI